VTIIVRRDKAEEKQAVSEQPQPVKNSGLGQRIDISEKENAGIAFPAAPTTTVGSISYNNANFITGFARYSHDH